jgi:hypothetical protein
MILEHASQALDEELAAALLRGLLRAVELHGELVDAAARSREEPTVPQRVVLGSVDTVDAKGCADFSVLVDRVVRAVGVASVTIAFGPADLGVQIWNGYVTGFDAQQSITATLELEELRVDGSPVLPRPCTLAEGRRSTDWRAATLPRPIPLEINP